MSDLGIWNRCTLKSHLDAHTLNIPAPKVIPTLNEEFPYVIVGDEIFPLSKNLMIPYSKQQLQYRDDRRIFNYR